jgi:hypothetical protein
MTLSQALGFLASGLVLLTFGMRTMGPMRVAAIASNLAFIAYGLSLDLTPVWLLHGILLPLNAYRLLEWQRSRRRQARTDRRPALRRRGSTTHAGASSAGAAARPAGGLQAVLAPDDGQGSTRC